MQKLPLKEKCLTAT
ncbi:TPA: protein YmiD, partial [Escherichia coli]